jgi:hypothetical protein
MPAKAKVHVYSTVPFSPGSEEEEEQYYRDQREKRRIAATKKREQDARELWAAIRDETVAYDAFQRSGGVCDPENIDYHNWSVSKDILEETFAHVVGVDPREWD